jgi:hypothetical protein
MLNQPRNQKIFRNNRDGFVEFFHEQKNKGVPVLKDVRFGEYMGSQVSREVLEGFRTLNVYEVIFLTTPHFDLYYVNDERVGGWYDYSLPRFNKEELSCFQPMAREFFQKF